MKKLIPHILLFALLLTGACTKYDAAPFTGQHLPRKSGYSTGVTFDWLYINLRTGEYFNRERPNKDIREGEQKERTDWDIAFCGYVMRTNSGTSGNGLGGAIDMGYGGYRSLTSLSQLPKNPEWVVDTDKDVSVVWSMRDWTHYVSEQILAGNFAGKVEDYPWFDPNKGPQKTLTSANPMLSQSMTFAGPPPVYTPSFHTYVVRTADGERFFKIQIISWYDANVQIGDEGGKISYYCDELK